MGQGTEIQGQHVLWNTNSWSELRFSELYFAPQLSMINPPGLERELTTALVSLINTGKSHLRCQEVDDDFPVTPVHQFMAGPVPGATGLPWMTEES